MKNKKNTLKKRGYITIKEKIPFLKGRPEREHAISHEDIIDLEIILNTNDTVDDILEELDI